MELTRTNSFWLRVEAVFVPVCRVCLDVFANAVEITIIANDVVVIVAMPEAPIVGWPTGFLHAAAVAYRGDGLEPFHDVAEREHRRVAAR
jgi:hypothetical protein